jgi:CubicO group peptidase (beta-lactamase class C family)
VRAFDQVRHWPVDTVAIAVVGADGQVVGEHGPQDHVFDIASLTKLLTTYAVLIAVEEGALGLDDSAGPPGATIRHLLAHASGLAPDSRTAAARVGTRRIYSDAGFELVAEAVEVATGMDFATYLNEAVLTPLGMSASVLTGSPAKGVRSTAGDMGLFLAEVQQPRLLAGETVAAATTVAFPGLSGVLPGYGRQDPNDWGLGFEIRDRKTPHWTGTTSSPRTCGHFGRSGTFAWIDAEAGCACVCLADRAFGPWAVEAWPLLTDAILTELAEATMA